ncbi:MAG: TIGR00269 family protein [Candidatus Woesearchaeota archaeon]
MKCKCKKKAVFQNLCKEHFCASVEAKVMKILKIYVKPTDKIIVAVSGGKDSLTVLSLVNTYAKTIALCIDEGITGYRNNTVEDMVSFCKERNIEYVIVTFKDEFNISLDGMTKILKENPCTVCGAFRRHLLNKKARELGATVLVTGHNMDDESQAVMMNLMRHQTDILPRLGPKTGVVKDDRFIPRVKPLYFVSEKEVAAYAFLKGFKVTYKECPYAVQAYRASVCDFLNDVELLYSGAKQKFIHTFMKKLPVLRKNMHITDVKYCRKCSEPCVGDLCKACQLLEKLWTS